MGGDRHGERRVVRRLRAMGRRTGSGLEWLTRYSTSGQWQLFPRMWNLVRRQADASGQAGLLACRFLRSHPGVGPVDFIIAATAELHEASLWTRNVKHVPMISDLARPY